MDLMLEDVGRNFQLEVFKGNNCPGKTIFVAVMVLRFRSTMMAATTSLDPCRRKSNSRHQKWLRFCGCNTIS